MTYASRVTLARQCTRTACARPAAATLTYVYADQVAVLGPLATYAEPHSYDLCDQHAERLTAPRGWEVVRLATDGAPPQTHDDLVALANVVREAKRPSAPPANLSPPPGPPGSRRSHLRAVPSASSTD
ncbi:DUF3499 domain-containing protein [Nostocoides veronense]|uniref:DUF3499 domain-containing protein n=1 Tax=Nostocoides veronense TaxID=330836 RepID=A0ABP4XUJ1_9MICO